MSNQISYEQVKEAVADADMVLVGIGEEFECQDFLQENSEYTALCEKIASAGTQWMMPYVNGFFLKDSPQIRKAYQNLKLLLDGKNFFLISVVMNGQLKESGIRDDRIVEPCGNFDKMQCGLGCLGTVKKSENELLREIEMVCRGEKEPDDVHCPCIEGCGHDAEFNSLYAEHYLEEGYREKWNLYTKWLQGTLNRKLCVLELGSNLMFASVLRFRFEKIVGLNQKAKLIRIHHSLYQLPEEIAARSVGISQNAVDFMAEMQDL